MEAFPIFPAKMCKKITWCLYRIKYCAVMLFVHLTVTLKNYHKQKHSGYLIFID